MEKIKALIVTVIETLSLVNLVVVIPAYLFLASVSYAQPAMAAPRPEVLVVFLVSYALILFVYRRVLHNFDTPVKKWMLGRKGPQYRAQQAEAA